MPEVGACWAAACLLPLGSAGVGVGVLVEIGVFVGVSVATGVFVGVLVATGVGVVVGGVDHIRGQALPPVQLPAPLTEVSTRRKRPGAVGV